MIISPKLQNHPLDRAGEPMQRRGVNNQTAVMSPATSKKVPLYQVQDIERFPECSSM